MSVKIKYLNGPHAGEEILVGDEKDDIAFGRAIGSDVTFPDDLTVVSREHFGLRKEVGGYKFVINPEKPVFMNGRPLYDGQALPRSAEVILGTQQGPRLSLERIEGHGSNQPETQVLRTQREVAQDLYATRSRGNRTAVLTVTVALLLLIVGAAGYLISQSLRTDVAATQSTVASVQQQLTQVSTDLPAVRQQIAQIQESNIDAASIIAKNKDSLYLVKVVGANGTSFGGATASVVLLPDGKKALATNAHVGKELEEAKSKGAKFVAVQSKGPKYETIEIVSVRIHPGYDLFNDWANGFAMKGNVGASTLSFAPSFDVSLLFVSDPDQLGPPTTLASRETIDGIKSGDPLLMIGFPSEGTHRIDEERPEPISQTGRIVSLTDFFLQGSDAAHDQLVAHSLPSAGGSSGSPMFDSKGEVVAYNNAGTGVAIKTEDGARVSNAVMINYGQRADLMLDLIADKAKDQVEAIKKQFAEGENILSLTPDQQIGRVMDILAYKAGGAKNVTELGNFDGDMATPVPEMGSPKSFVRSFDVLSDGTYAFLVQSADGRPVLPVMVVGDQTAAARRPGAIAFVAVGLKKGMKLSLVVGDLNAAMGRAKDDSVGKVHVRAFQLPPEKPDAED